MEDIKNKTDEELVGFIGENLPIKAQHPQAELTRRLLVATREFNSSTEKYSNILIFLAIVTAAITVLQILLFIKFQLPIIRLEGQKEILGVIESCKFDPSTTWIDEGGRLHPCSEMPGAWFRK